MLSVNELEDRLIDLAFAEDIGDAATEVNMIVLQKNHIE